MDKSAAPRRPRCLAASEDFGRRGEPGSILPMSKPALRIHSAQQASNRVSSVIVAALYPSWAS